MIDLVAILIIFALWAYALVRWTRTKARVVELGISSAILAYTSLFIVTGIVEGYNFELIFSDIAAFAVLYAVLAALLITCSLFMLGGSDTFDRPDEDRVYIQKQLTTSGLWVAILCGIVLLVIRVNVAEGALQPHYMSGQPEVSTEYDEEGNWTSTRATFSIATEPLHLPGTTVLPIALGVWWLWVALRRRWNLIGPLHVAAFVYTAALLGSCFALREVMQPLADWRILVVLGVSLAVLALLALAAAPVWRTYRRGFSAPAILQLGAIAILASYYALMLYAHIQSRPYVAEMVRSVL